MRLPIAAFGALVAATVGAFFVTQHLKVTTPLIAGIRGPDPGSINPVSGTTCERVDHRGTKVSFYLLHRADDVNVYVTDQGGAVIRTLASGRHMRRAVRNPDGDYYWNGREDSGSVAPDGTYYIAVALIHQGRTVTLSNPAGPLPVKVVTRKPLPVVDSVSPHLIHGPGTPVTIRYSGNEGAGGTVLMYRTDVPARPRLVKSFQAGQPAIWNGKIHERPAPPGIYLVGLQITDAACNRGYFPSRIPPAPGSTPGAGVTVRYLAAQPPLRPVPAGRSALVSVDSRGQPYRWSLQRAGASPVLSSGVSDKARLRVPLPPGRPGLYELRLEQGTGAHSTTVPLVAYSPAPARTLVVLPSLTWQALNPVDDTGDGLPATLDTAKAIQLARPLADALPPGFSDEAGLLSFLDASHIAYQLTTDLGLIEGAGPVLAGHAAVILAGAERWLPPSIAAALRGYVENGGRVLSLGIDSLRRQVTVRASKAVNPVGPATTDVFGTAPAPLVTHNSAPISTGQDRLGILHGVPGPLLGYASYQPMTVTGSARVLSQAGVKPNAPCLVGFSLGRGVVVQIGIPGLGVSLAHNYAAQRLVAQISRVLGA